MKEVITRSPY